MASVEHVESEKQEAGSWKQGPSESITPIPYLWTPYQQVPPGFWRSSSLTPSFAFLNGHRERAAAQSQLSHEAEAPSAGQGQCPPSPTG